MTKMELAQALAEKVPGMTISQAIAATEGVIGVISDALVAGDTLTLRGFATIKPVTLAPRKGRDIAAGKVIDVPARRSVKLVLSKELKARMNKPAAVLNDNGHGTKKGGLK